MWSLQAIVSFDIAEVNGFRYILLFSFDGESQ